MSAPTTAPHAHSEPERDPPPLATGYSLLLLGLLVVATIFACTGLALHEMNRVAAASTSPATTEHKVRRTEQESKLNRIDVGVRRVIAESRER